MTEDLLINTLESIGYKAYIQGSLMKDEYPESFFTYWNTDSEVESYDNEDKSILWSFWVNFYSTNPGLITETMKQVRTKLKEKGFIVEGLGSDLLCDRPEWSAKNINVYYKEII